VPRFRGQPEASGAGIAVTHLGVVGFSGGGGESDDLDGRRAGGFGGRLLAVGRRLRRAGVEQVAVAEGQEAVEEGGEGGVVEGADDRAVAVDVEEAGQDRGGGAAVEVAGRGVRGAGIFI
jgi:hypothetical protein